MDLSQYSNLMYKEEKKEMFRRFPYAIGWDKTFSRILFFVCVGILVVLYFQFSFTPIGRKIQDILETKEVMVVSYIPYLDVGGKENLLDRKEELKKEDKDSEQPAFIQVYNSGGDNEGSKDIILTPVFGVWKEGMEYMGLASWNYSKEKLEKIQNLIGLENVKYDSYKITFPIGIVPNKYRKVVKENLLKNLKELEDFKKDKVLGGGRVFVPEDKIEFDFTEVTLKRK